MAIVQRFELTLPGHPDTFSLERADALELYRDLGEALGYSRELQQHHQLHQEYIPQGPWAGEEAEDTSVLPEGTERFSVEAAAQAMARMAETRQPHLANPNQPRGSAIGNRHT